MSSILIDTGNAYFETLREIIEECEEVSNKTFNLSLLYTCQKVSTISNNAMLNFIEQSLVPHRKSIETRDLSILQELFPGQEKLTLPSQQKQEDIEKYLKSLLSMYDRIIQKLSSSQ